MDAEQFAISSKNEILQREQNQARLVKAALAQAPHSPVPLGEQVRSNFMWHHQVQIACHLQDSRL